MGIRKELLEEGTGIEREKKGLTAGRVRKGTERWRIVGVYGKKEGLEGILGDLERWADEREEGIRTIVGGTLMRGRGGRGEELRREVIEIRRGVKEEDQRTKNWIRKEGYW